MLSLSKYCCVRQGNRNSFSKLIRKFILKKEYDRQLEKNNYYVPIQNATDCNKSRSYSTQTLLKPKPIEFSREDRDEFTNFLPNIIRDLTQDETYSNIPEATKRFSNVLQYHLPFGSNIFGLFTLFAYKTLEKQENLTADNIKLGAALAWCNELMCVSMLLFDDIMDNSETRRNNPCWFRVDGIGLTAINDAVFLENSCYAILKKYFSSLPSYVPIMESLRDTHLKLIYGQCMDNTKVKLDQMTMDRFNRIAMYKGSYYLLLLPTILGMHLSGIYSPELHREIQPILLELGRYLTVENDMFDCFADVKLTGKIGNDIQEGKCTWLAAIVLQKANPSQRKVMEEHYGRPEIKSAKIIRDLYEELDICAEFNAFKDEAYKRICTHIEEISTNDAMRKLLFALTRKLCCRGYE